MRSIATLTAALAGLLVLASPALAQATTQTLSGIITTSRTLDATQVYLLDGEVYVESGVTLTIPAGTLIKGKQNPTAGTGASVLVIQRGGRLVANGTAAAPIVFTAETDDTANAFDLSEAARGLWGGVVILGNATNNRGVRTIEGIPPSIRTSYGCGDAAFPTCNDDGDSGSLRYVSIRHAGFTLEANLEINGLTLGGVGRGTTLDYIEVFANSDDSFEFFGGTVNASHLVGVFSGDDDLDWDTGYTGRIQFMFSLKDESGELGRCIEGDGSVSPFTAAGQSSPTVSNLTCIGSGVGSAPAGDDAGGPSVLLRENTGGFLYNSVFTSVQNPGGALDLEVRTPTTVSTRQNFDDGELDIRNNVFFDFSAGNDAAGIVNGADTALETAIAGRNTIASPGFVSVSRSQNRGLNPRPSAGGPAGSGAVFTYAPLQNAFFAPTTYRGAFAPNVPAWAAGWTALDRNQYFSASIGVAAEGGVLAAEGVRLAVAPNPAPAGAAVLRLALPEAMTARLAVYDVLGREVAVVADQAFGEGEQTFSLGTQLPAGVYVARLQTARGTTAVQFTVVR